MCDGNELKQIVDRLDASAKSTAESAEKLASELEVATDLASQDRVQVARLIVLTKRLLASSGRLETTSHEVAEDLAERDARADAAAEDEAGASADAAARSAPNGETNG